MGHDLLVYEVTGRDLLSLNRDAWQGIVGQVGGVLLNLPLQYRWITVAQPATMQSIKQQLEDELAFAQTPADRERIQAQLLHINDLTGSGIQDVRHFLLLWTDVNPTSEATLTALLQSVFGRVKQRASLPALWGASSYRATPHGLVAHDGSHVWKGGLNDTLRGAILPDIWVSIFKKTFPIMIMIDVRTFTSSEAERAMDDAMMRFGSHAVGQKGFHQGRKSRIDDWRKASDLLSKSAQLSHIQIGVWVQGATMQDATRHFEVVADQLATWLPLRRCYGRQMDIARFLTHTPESEVLAKKVLHPAVTSQVATLLPWGIPHNTITMGVYLGTDLIRKTMFLMPLERVAAMHACIFGMTGMGKTTLAIMWLFRLIKGFGYQGIVLDPQNAFSNLADLFPDGSYNRVTLRVQDGHSAIRINILDPIVDDLHHELYAQTEHVITTLTWILKVSFTLDQRQQLTQGLAILYGGLSAMGRSDGVHAPLLSDLVAILDERDPHDGTGVIRMVRMLTQVPYASIYNQSTTLDLRLDPTTPLIVYDFDVSMPEDQKVLFLTLILKAIQREVRRRPRRGVLTIDEAGMLFRYPVVADTAEEAASTLRRFGFGLWMIDQLLDLLKTPQGRRVFKNAFITALGRLQADERETLQTLFPTLTDTQITDTLALDKTREELEREAGKFTLVVNNQVYVVHNSMTTYEQQIMPRSAVV